MASLWNQISFNLMEVKISWSFFKDGVKIYKIFIDLGPYTKTIISYLRSTSTPFCCIPTSICNASKVRTKIWEMRSSNIYYVNISSFREPIVESIQNLNFTLGIPTTTKKLVCNQKLILPIEYGYGMYSFNFHQNFLDYFLVKAVWCLISPKMFLRSWGR